MKYDFPIFVPIIVERLRMIVLGYWSAIYTFIQTRIWGVQCGKGCRFVGRAILRTRRVGSIALGEGVKFISDRKINVVGLACPNILDTINGGRILIGNHSGFSSVSMSSHSSITIGNYVMVGGNTKIFDHDFHAVEADFRKSWDDRNHVRTKPVAIGDSCFIGANAIILKGTQLGARTIVAAGSVVFGLITPPDSLVKGNPAKIVERHHTEC